MAEAQATPVETLELRFVTYHNSAGNVHLRTDGPFLFIDKKKEALVELSKSLARGQAIRVQGRTTFSSTLSTYVFDVEELEVA
jgi:hypothetical protein